MSDNTETNTAPAPATEEAPKRVGLVGNAFLLKKKKGQKKVNKTSPAVIRVSTDLNDIDKRWQLDFPDPNNLLEFKLTITPEDGIWKGKKHEFTISIPNEYPIQPPKCQCLTKIWHPNIDTEGKVCLNILRAEWKPVLTLNAVFIGLNFLFLEPNPEDPLNHEAAQQYSKEKDKFIRKAKAWMEGNYNSYYY
eukprot:GEZU01013118.1.p1 GENE.GEZU01013118.1~~GEZU01013118.1.p1  ORF type:complete len:192 (-),score=75.21 GEZU01013118.1:57-632(-)